MGTVILFVVVTVVLNRLYNKIFHVVHVSFKKVLTEWIVCFLIAAVIVGAIMNFEKDDAEKSNTNYEKNVEESDMNYEENAEESDTNYEEDEDYYDDEEDYSEYVLPYSSESYYSEEDLEGLSADECRIARNEIYARHGRIFDDAELQNYFESLSWYEPSVSGSDFSDSVLNEVERYNLDVIIQYEETMGYR